MSGAIIIIEGADGTGKTTLGKRIVEKTRGRYLHNRYHKDVWPFFAATLRQAAREAWAGKTVVIDRHWPSECVYARVYRGGTVLGPAVRSLHRVLRRFGAAYVIANPPVAVTVANHARLKGERPEMYSTMEEVAKKFSQFVAGTGEQGPVDADLVEQLARGGLRSRPGWFNFDYRLWDTPAKLDDLVERVLWYAKVCRDTDWLEVRNPAHWNLAGHLSSQSTLVVADRVSDPGACTPWPFFSRHGSTAYLNKTLHQLRIDEDKFCLVNANDPNPPMGLKALSEICRRVVALGKTAEETLNHLEIPISATARHPQHARRFTYHDRSYADELEAALDPAAEARL